MKNKAQSFPNYQTRCTAIFLGKPLPYIGAVALAYGVGVTITGDDDVYEVIIVVEGIVDWLTEGIETLPDELFGLLDVLDLTVLKPVLIEGLGITSASRWRIIGD